MNFRISLRGLIFLGSVGLAGVPALAAPGEYWEITSKMEMAGMPFAMPANTVKVCLPKGNERDPRHSADKDCVVSEVQNSGNKTSWKMQCNTKDGVMIGTGESSGTPDAMEGKMHMTGTSGGRKIDMTTSYKNKRIGGACDTDEMQKYAKAAQAAGEANLAKMCDTSNFTTDRWLGSASMFIGAKPTCPGKQDALCAAVKRDVGRNPHDYFNFTRHDPNAIAAACGVSTDSLKRSLCSNLDAGNNEIRRQLESREIYRMMQSECPGEMKLYAENTRKRYCQGRTFTGRQKAGMEECLRGVDEPDGTDDSAPAPTARKKGTPKAKAEAAAPATAPAEERAEQPPAQQNPLGLPDLPPNLNPAGAILDGAKKLKGIFGF